MFQCLGLGTSETGGCGEDWYHPGCIVGLGPDWFEKMDPKDKPKSAALKTEVKTESGSLPTIAEDETTEQNGAHAEEAEEEDEDDDPPPPPGFPADDDFEGFICYKCIEAYPWIKRYAGTQGFLPPVYLKKEEEEQTTSATSELEVNGDSSSKKRKASDEDNEDIEESQEKKPKTDDTVQSTTTAITTTASLTTNGSSTTTTTTHPTSTPKPCLLSSLPAPPPPSQTSQTSPFSLFFTTPSFRSLLCHCSQCFPLLIPHPHLLEEEDTYEPPVSETSSSSSPSHSLHGGSSSKGSGSVLERGESALRNIDRVRAIEGVMAYNHLKDKLKPFFREFAESGRAVSAEDIKAYFAKLRGDDEVRGHGTGEEEDGGVNGDGRKEQDGY